MSASDACNRRRLLLLSDGMSPHTLKWVRELIGHFDLYLISFGGISDELGVILLNKKRPNRVVSLGFQNKAEGGNFGVVRAIPRVLGFCRRIRPSFIFSHYITSYGFVGAIAKRIVCRNSMFAVSAWGSDVLVTPWKCLAYRLLTRFVLTSADIVTSDSRFMSDHIQEIAAPRRLLTFPFGVEALPECREDDKETGLIFSNRALEPNYNIGSVLTWFASLLNRDRRMKLVVANEGSERTGLENMVRKLGIDRNVKFVGFLSTVEQTNWYSRAKYYISIPTSDSTSASLLEAMSFGCTPIVSDIPANREWVEPDRTGLLFSDELSFDKLKALSAFSLNREIILRRAIWKDNVLQFLNTLNQIENEAGLRTSKRM